MIHAIQRWDQSLLKKLVTSFAHVSQIGLSDISSMILYDLLNWFILTLDDGLSLF